MRRASGLGALVFLLFVVATPLRADDPSLVLRQTKLAAGGGKLDELKAIRTTFRLRQSGLEGSGTTLTDIGGGRTVTRFILGPMTGAEGHDGKRFWFQDSAGIVTVPEGADRRAQNVSAQFRQSLAHWFPKRSVAAPINFRLQLFQSRVKEALEIAPQGGLAFELWFDAQTKLLDRAIEVGATETRTTIYQDYRPFQGLVIPYRILTSNAAAVFGAERTITKVELNPAVADADFAIPAPPKPDYAFSGVKREVVLPFRFVNNHVYADVRLNGRVFSLLIDTGAANVMTPEVARALRLRSVGDARVWGAGETSERAEFTRVARVALGNVRLRDQLFAVVPLEKLNDVEGVPFHGMIGYELFKRFVVRIDYEARKLTLTDPSIWNEQGAGVAVPFVFNGTVPEIEGDIDGVPAAFDIDTGSRASVGLNSPFVQRHALRARFVPNVEAVTGWGIGGPTRASVARVKRLRLGSIAINDVIVDMSRHTQGVMSHGAPAGSVGSGLLKRFAMTFDYAGQRVFFLPHERTATRDAFDRSGLWINRGGGGFRIDGVVARSPAGEAGLKDGDVITAVDGKPASAMSLSELRDRMRDAPLGSEVRLSVRSGGVMRAVVLRLRDLI
ncbi:MAG: aspartyl protease family protein [Alphaproteobacteria bacterium]|nr:aspartyl protease family protein [Alphaproteobacteria bacterium]